MYVQVHYVCQVRYVCSSIALFSVKSYIIFLIGRKSFLAAIVCHTCLCVTTGQYNVRGENYSWTTNIKK